MELKHCEIVQARLYLHQGASVEKESSRQRMYDLVELALTENCTRREYKQEMTAFVEIRIAV